MTEALKLKYSYVSNWTNFLSIKFIDLYTYEFEDIKISFSLKEPLLPSRDTLWNFGFDDYIHITHILSNKEIKRFDKNFLFKIYSKFNKTDDIILTGEYSEKFLVTTLIKILVEYPKFMKDFRIKEKKEKEFLRCLNKDYPDFDNLNESNISIQDFKVYKLYSQSEVCQSRVGKDNRFHITEITEWHLKYDNMFITTEYVQSLLPPKILNEWSDYAYSSTLIGGNRREFKVDKEKTQEFKRNLKLDRFINSIRPDR